MTLFTIHCTTCRARLRVKDAVAIGQILDCPKCGSLVQVTPPAGWQPPAAAEVVQSIAPAAAASADALASASSSSLDTLATAANPAAAEPHGNTEANMANQPPPLPAHRTRSLRRSMPQLSDELAAAAPARSLWWSWPVLAVGAAAGLVLSVGLWMWLASGPAVQTADGGTSDAARSADETKAAVADDESETERSPADAADDDESAAEEASAAPETDDDVDEPIVPSADADPDETLAAADTPPDDDPQSDASPIAADETSADDVPLDPADDDATPVGDVAAPAPLEVTDSDERLRIEARLADRLPKLEFANVPLADFLQFLSEFSTLPIKLDEPAMRAVGRSADVRVKLRLVDTSVEAALTAALAPHGLVHELRAGVLVVTAK